jgi:hypothetical protein
MKINKRIFIILLAGFFLVLLTFAKLNFSFGANHLTFSFSNMIYPVFGAFLGLIDLVVIKWFSLILLVLFTGKMPITLVMFGIPSFLAALTFRYSLSKNYKSKIFDFCLRVLIPIISISIFIYNYSAAYAYSFYWLIPMFLYFLTRKKVNIFYSALSSTFIAHAVGGVFWIFSVNMTTQQWIGLIPVVAIERFSMAVGMSFVYILIKKSICVIKRRKKLKTIS